MQDHVSTTTLDRSEVVSCRHHWVIDAANGPTSHGRCKHCGQERDFFNNPEDAPKREEQLVSSH